MPLNKSRSTRGSIVTPFGSIHIRSFILTPCPFCEQVSRAESENRPPGHQVRPADRCHREHGRNGFVRGGRVHFHRPSKRIRPQLRAVGHHQVWMDICGRPEITEIEPCPYWHPATGFSVVAMATTKSILVTKLARQVLTKYFGFIHASYLNYSRSYSH